MKVDRQVTHDSIHLNATIMRTQLAMGYGYPVSHINADKSYGLSWSSLALRLLGVHIQYGADDPLTLPYLIC